MNRRLTRDEQLLAGLLADAAADERVRDQSQWYWSEDGGRYAPPPTEAENELDAMSDDEWHTPMRRFARWWTKGNK